MAINRISPAGGISGTNPKVKESVPVSKSKQDVNQVRISREAKETSGLLQLSKAVKEAPDIRPDRVEEVKKKLQNPDYINADVLEKLADKIMDSFGI